MFLCFRCPAAHQPVSSAGIAPFFFTASINHALPYAHITAFASVAQPNATPFQTDSPKSTRYSCSHIMAFYSVAVLVGIVINMAGINDHDGADGHWSFLALLCRGVALLNSAGPLQDTDSPELAEPMPVPWYAGIQEELTAVAKRVVLWFAFQRAKQPERIKEVLQMVYSSNGGLAGCVVVHIGGIVWLCILRGLG